MNHIGASVYTNGHLYSEVPLIALLGLVHFRVPFFLLVLSVTGSGSESCIDNRATMVVPSRVGPVDKNEIWAEKSYSQPIFYLYILHKSLP